MRLIHRYLGFFLAGIMAVYAISGIVLVFRNTDLLKRETTINTTVGRELSPVALGKELRIKNLKVINKEGEWMQFEQGIYNSQTGEVKYAKMELPYVLDKMTHMHKATTKSPLFYLNIGFGLSLLFFVISSFWMFVSSSSVFKKGLYFALGGIVLTMIILFV
ncbi:MAG: hypothetical protein OCD76_07675 [Reichenbachiella sp.]